MTSMSLWKKSKIVYKLSAHSYHFSSLLSSSSLSGIPRCYHTAITTMKSKVTINIHLTCTYILWHVCLSSLSQVEWLVYDELLSRARELASHGASPSLLRSVATHVQTSSHAQNCHLTRVNTEFVCGATHCQQQFLKVHVQYYSVVSTCITIIQFNLLLFVFCSIHVL